MRPEFLRQKYNGDLYQTEPVFHRSLMASQRVSITGRRSETSRCYGGVGWFSQVEGTVVLLVMNKADWVRLHFSEPSFCCKIERLSHKRYGTRIARDDRPRHLWLSIRICALAAVWCHVSGANQRPEQFIEYLGNTALPCENTPGRFSCIPWTPEVI